MGLRTVALDITGQWRLAFQRSVMAVASKLRGLTTWLTMGMLPLFRRVKTESFTSQSVSAAWCGGAGQSSSNHGGFHRAGCGSSVSGWARSWQWLGCCAVVFALHYGAVGDLCSGSRGYTVLCYELGSFGVVVQVLHNCAMGKGSR